MVIMLHFTDVIYEDTLVLYHYSGDVAQLGEHLLDV